jgi:hypothetical protein
MESREMRSGNRTMTDDGGDDTKQLNKPFCTCYPVVFGQIDEVFQKEGTP